MRKIVIPGTGHLETALRTEKAILVELRIALLEEWRTSRNMLFIREIRAQIREQGFRIAALQRAIRSKR